MVNNFNKFKFIKTNFKNLDLIKPKIFRDGRGDFFRFFCSNEFNKIFFKNKIVQSNICVNNKIGILRGLHYQKKPYEETKIITCVQGEVFDVAVDLRKKSKTYMKYYGQIISESNKFAVLIPKGFAHGYITLKKKCTIIYLVDSKYKKNSEGVINYNDKKINIKWPIKPKYISNKDRNVSE